MIERKFKRYAYFSRLSASDLASMGCFEYALNMVIDDINETLSIGPIMQVNVRDILRLFLLPARLFVGPIFYALWMRKVKAKDIKDDHFVSGFVTWTVDWKTRFQSRPSIWNDY